MTRFTLPNLTFLLTVSMSGALISATALAGESSKMRVDCRYFSSSSRFCYSSATYNVSKSGDIEDLRFGVGCDYETIFDDGAITSPQDELSDNIHPRTAALPRIEITPKGSLRHPGTFTSKLEIDSGRLADGTCYVREVDENESQTDYFRRFQEQLYFQ